MYQLCTHATLCACTHHEACDVIYSQKCSREPWGLTLTRHCAFTHQAAGIHQRSYTRIQRCAIQYAIPSSHARWAGGAPLPAYNFDATENHMIAAMSKAWPDRYEMVATPSSAQAETAKVPASEGVWQQTSKTRNDTRHSEGYACDGTSPCRTLPCALSLVSDADARGIERRQYEHNTHRAQSLPLTGGQCLVGWLEAGAL